VPVIARVRGFIDHLLRYRPRHYPVLKRFANDAADAVGILLSFVMNTLAATTSRPIQAWEWPWRSWERCLPPRPATNLLCAQATFQHRPIIIQQSQSQSCCAGTGCDSLFAIILLVIGAAYVWEAMTGVYGVGWQIVAWAGAVVLVVVLVLGVVAFLDQKLDWGLTEPSKPTTPGAQSRSAEDVLETENYDMADEAPPQPPADIPAQVARSAQLRDRGVITRIPLSERDMKSGPAWTRTRDLFLIREAL
jgi:hypothetical protein